MNTIKITETSYLYKRVLTLPKGYFGKLDGNTFGGISHKWPKEKKETSFKI